MISHSSSCHENGKPLDGEQSAAQKVTGKQSEDANWPEKVEKVPIKGFICKLRIILLSTSPGQKFRSFFCLFLSLLLLLLFCFSLFCCSCFLFGYCCFFGPIWSSTWRSHIRSLFANEDKKQLSSDGLRTLPMKTRNSCLVTDCALCQWRQETAV